MFDDDEEDSSSDKKPVPSKGVSNGVNKKYLDEKWELNKEDAKDFKGFPSEKASSESGSDVDYPSYALMYKFRREYKDQDIDALVGEHRGHCLKFKRVVSSEVIELGVAKGAVLLWTGLSAADKEDLKAEIMSFLEEDPLITKDVVENWDLIDLDLNGESADIEIDKSEILPALLKPKF